MLRRTLPAVTFLLLCAYSFQVSASAKAARYVYVTTDTVVSIYTPTSGGKLRSDGFALGDPVLTFIASRLDPLGRFFFGLTNTGCNAITAYTVAPDTGLLTEVPGSPFSTTSLAGANTDQQAIAITPNGKFLYSTGNEDGAICNGHSANSGIHGASIDPTTGALTPISGSPFGTGRYPLGGVVDGQSKFLFTADNTPVEKISVFSIDATTGALTEIANSPFDICGPPCDPAYVVLSPGGGFLFALLSNMQVAVFTVNSTTGEIAQITNSPFPAHGAFPTGLPLIPRAGTSTPPTASSAA